MTRPARSTFRRRSNYLLAYASELAGPALRAADLVRRRAAPSPPAGWRQALLLGAGHIGDVLYNTGSLPALASAFPDCRWHFAAASPAADVLAGNPHLAGLIDPASLPARAKEFDAVICYDSTASWRNLLRTWRLGIPNRAGYVHKGFSSLVTHPITFQPPRPYAAYFRDLVSQLTGRPPNWSLRPLVYPSAEHEHEADRLHGELQLDSARPLLAGFFTGRQPSGIWPADHFARALKIVHERVSCESVLLGAPADEPVLRALVERHRLPSRVAAGRLSLRALVCFLRRCRAVLAADSGPRHLANAAGVRVLFVPNLAVGKVETGRYLETETDLVPDMEFVPIARQPAAFAAIDPQRVAEAVAGALSNASG